MTPLTNNWPLNLISPSVSCVCPVIFAQHNAMVVPPENSLDYDAIKDALTEKCKYFTLSVTVHRPSSIVATGLHYLRHLNCILFL